MTSEETSVHKLAYAISIQDGGERRILHKHAHFMGGKKTITEEVYVFLSSARGKLYPDYEKKYIAISL